MNEWLYELSPLPLPPPVEIAKDMMAVSDEEWKLKYKGLFESKFPPAKSAESAESAESRPPPLFLNYQYQNQAKEMVGHCICIVGKQDLRKYRRKYTVAVNPAYRCDREREAP